MNDINKTNKTPSVYVILLNWNGWRDTIDCLSSLKQVTYQNLHIVILDNASTDNSIEEMSRWIQKNGMLFSLYVLESRKAFPGKIIDSQPCQNGPVGVSILSSSSNLGFCAGNNVAMEFAARENADYFLVLNNDTICEKGFLEPMVRVAVADNNAGLVGGSIYYANMPDVKWWDGGELGFFLGFRRSNKSLEKNVYVTDWVVGCMMLIPRKIFEVFGGFDENFFAWCEDVELSIRIRKNGYSLLLVPESKIFHKVSRSIGVRSPLAYYYFARNSLLLRKKHLGKTGQIFFLAYFLSSWFFRCCVFLLRRRFDLVRAGCMGIRDYFLGYTGEMRKD